MNSEKAQIGRNRGFVGMISITKTLVLWMMLISGIVLATRQASAIDSGVRISIGSKA